MAAAYGNAIPAWGDSGSVLLNLVATTRRVQHGGGENGDSISAESSYVAPRPSRYGMSYFEFLMVLIGLVGAIAVSEILVFWGHAIRNWGSVRGPGLLGAACSLMLFNVIGHVTGIWAYRDVEFGYYQTFVVVLPVVVLALGITILVPGSDREKITDFEAHYFSVAPAAFGCIALFGLLALLADQLPGVQEVPPWWYMLATAGLFVTLALVRNRAVHIVVWIALFGMTALSAAVMG